MGLREEYKSLMEDRPEKLDEESVKFRDSMGRRRCGNCINHFKRSVDDYGVCEVVRPSDPEEVTVDSLCDLWTSDGKNFPLL